jgi:hypothetical protein
MRTSSLHLPFCSGSAIIVIIRLVHLNIEQLTNDWFSWLFLQADEHLPEKEILCIPLIIVQLVVEKKHKKVSSKNEVYLHLYTHRAHGQAHIRFEYVHIKCGIALLAKLRLADH